MSKTSPRNVRDAVLVWLSELAQRGGGYHMRGQPGWASPADAAAAIGRLAREVLVQLAGSGKLDRVNIALSGGRMTAAWLYRINAAGASAAGLPAPSALAPAPEAAGPRAIFTDAQWLAIEVLREAKRAGTRLRFSQEPGWRTTHEIREAGLRTTPGLQAEDVYGLARAGLLEMRRGSNVEGIRQIHFYRVTPLGEAVERLVWHPPAAPGRADAAG